MISPFASFLKPILQILRVRIGVVQGISLSYDFIEVKKSGLFLFFSFAL